MDGTLKGLAIKINNAGDKSKKYADIYYLFSLFLFIAVAASSQTRTVYGFIPTLLIISEMLLFPIGIYRIVFGIFKKQKSVIFAIALIVFSVIYSNFSDDVIPFTFIAFAIVGGMGVEADRILKAGIGGNIGMILYNLFVFVFNEEGLFVTEYQDRKLFFFGKNIFYMPKINNCSSTDFAAHYFWMMTAYLWIRGKKITWAELFALGALDILVYSLTGSNTSFLCMAVVIFCAFLMKIVPHVSEGSKGKEGIRRIGTVIDKIIMFLNKSSFLIIGAVCIAITLLFDIGNPAYLKLNELLHWRLGLGFRGFMENGIHLIAPDINIYGMSSSADGYFNFLDCSYISLLIGSGILMFAFYMISMTAIQLKHKNYIYGVVLLTVCAVSCIEEHHLSEINYNFFILLLFADFCIAKKTAPVTVPEDPKEKENNRKTGEWSRNLFFTTGLLLLAFAVAANLPRLRSISELNRLDKRAGEILSAVQGNLDNAVQNGTWDKTLSEADSYQYGEMLSKPEDFDLVTGIRWKNAIKNPKEHSYYYFYYDNETAGTAVTDILITDEIKNLIGEGSAIVEYDISAGKVYSVWVAEYKGCDQIEDGRNADRAGRLKKGVVMAEGYSTGEFYG